MTQRELINFRRQIDVMCDGTGRVSLTKSSVIALLDALEAAQTQWVPVSERLPKVDKYGEAYVLVSLNDEYIAT